MKENFNPSYVGHRDDIVKLIPSMIKKVLDVGCSVGTLGESIKQRDDAEVTGIEINEDMANVAKEKLDRVIVADIEKIDLSDYFPLNYFDCIIFADILEHLKNPWQELKNCYKFLDNGGLIIASIPNIRHYSTLINLLFKGYWPYRERGIHDITHLRFFTLKNIKEMFQNAGLEIIRVKRKYRILEKGHKYDRFSRYFAWLFLKDFLTFQYLVVARKTQGKRYEDLPFNS